MIGKTPNSNKVPFSAAKIGRNQWIGSLLILEAPKTGNWANKYMKAVPMV